MNRFYHLFFWSCSDWQWDVNSFLVVNNSLHVPQANSLHSSWWTERVWACKFTNCENPRVQSKHLKIIPYFIDLICCKSAVRLIYTFPHWQSCCCCCCRFSSLKPAFCGFSTGAWHSPELSACSVRYRSNISVSVELKADGRFEIKTGSLRGIAAPVFWFERLGFLLVDFLFRLLKVQFWKQRNKILIFKWIIFSHSSTYWNVALCSQYFWLVSKTWPQSWQPLAKFCK